MPPKYGFSTYANQAGGARNAKAVAGDTLAPALPATAPPAVGPLDEALHRLVATLIPPPEVEERDEGVRHRMEQTIQTKWRDARVAIFGSAGSGLRVGNASDVRSSAHDPLRRASLARGPVARPRPPLCPQHSPRHKTGHWAKDERSTNSTSWTKLTTRGAPSHRTSRPLLRWTCASTSRRMRCRCRARWTPSPGMIYICMYIYIYNYIYGHTRAHTHTHTHTHTHVWLAAAFSAESQRPTSANTITRPA